MINDGLLASLCADNCAVDGGNSGTVRNIILTYCRYLSLSHSNAVTVRLLHRADMTEA